MALNLRIESSGHNAIVYMISQFYLLASASFADIECKLLSHCCLHLFALGCICPNVNSVSIRPIINPPPPACCWLSSFDRLIPAQSPPACRGGRLSPLSDKLCDSCIESLVAVTEPTILWTILRGWWGCWWGWWESWGCWPAAQPRWFSYHVHASFDI